MRDVITKLKGKSLHRHKTMVLFTGGLACGFFLLLLAVVVSRVSPEESHGAASAQQANVASQESTHKPNTTSVSSSAPEVKASIYEKKSRDAKRGAAFADVDIEAKAAIVYDINSEQVLFGKNARTTFPLASITKVMTVVTAEELLSDGDIVPITARALATPGESQLRQFEEWEYRDIIDLTLITSSNDAATAIAEAAGARIEGEGDIVERFVERMNQKAVEIGMEHARFENPTGLDEQAETRAGAVASPLSVAKLFTYALEEHPHTVQHSRFQDYDFVSLNGRRWHVENTNEIAESLPGLIASKTGYTLLAGGNLAVVVDAGLIKPVVIVALGSTVDGRFSDVQELYRHLREYID